MGRKVADWVESLQYCHKIKHNNEPIITDRGNKRYVGFEPGGERYCIDFAEDFKSEGWQQFDTSQDAHYFGVWVNPVKLMTLCYCEGDWSLVVCEDIAHYNAEIQSMIDCYEEGFIAKAIDKDGSVTIYRQEREKFLVPV